MPSGAGSASGEGALAAPAVPAAEGSADEVVPDGAAEALFVADSFVSDPAVVADPVAEVVREAEPDAAVLRPPAPLVDEPPEPAGEDPFVVRGAEPTGAEPSGAAPLGPLVAVGRDVAEGRGAAVVVLVVGRGAGLGAAARGTL